MRALVALLVVLATPARANDLRDEARAHGELGRIAFKQQHFAEALAEFQKAYSLAPVPDILFNIGRCQEEMHAPAAAARAYEQYLAALPNAPERSELEVHIRELRAAAPQEKPPEKPPEKSPGPSIAKPAATLVEPAPQPVVKQRSRRGLVIGLSVGAGLLVAGAVTLGLVLGLSSTEPFHGNISPGFQQVNQ